MGIAVAALSLAAAGSFSEPALAQTAYCWINAQTGQPVPESVLVPQGSRLSDDNHASIPGQATYFRGAGGSWTNAATGQPVPASGIVPHGSRLAPERDAASDQGERKPGRSSSPAT